MFKFAISTLLFVTIAQCHPFAPWKSDRVATNSEESNDYDTIKTDEYVYSSRRRSHARREPDAWHGPTPANATLPMKDEITRIIERALETGDLIGPEEWTRRENERRLEEAAARRNRSTPEAQTGNERYRQRHGDSDSSSMQADAKFVFPRDDGSVSNLPPAPTCTGTTYCENVPNYPDQLVRIAIENNDRLKYLTTVDEITEVVQRIDPTDDLPLCLSYERVIFPRSAQNKQKEWLFVLNQGNVSQGVRVELCMEPGTTCKMYGGMSTGYTTTCKQKYIYRQLVAVTNEGKLKPDMFQFPSSCCCHVKFTGNPLARMNFNVNPQSPSPTTDQPERK